MEAFQSAAANGDWAHAQNFAVNLIDQPGDKSWPIDVGDLRPAAEGSRRTPTRSAAVMKFFDWAFKSGDASATSLEYVHLPDSVKEAVRAAWHASILSPDGKPIF